MSPWLRVSGLAALTVAICLSARLGVSPPSPQPARITTDTARYCRQLAGRVEALARAAPRAVPARAMALRAEGRRMCAQGRLRRGLLCLRRAVVLLAAPARRHAVVRAAGL
jgi:hypothetical protein